MPVTATRFAVGGLLLAVAAFGAGRQQAVGAQDAEDVPTVITALADLLASAGDDPFVAEYLMAPSEAGSLADDPIADVDGADDVEVGLRGPDLLRFSWFTVPAQHLVDGFAALVGSDSRPAGITLYGQDPWVAPAPDAMLVAVVAEFDRPLTVTLGSACITQLNIRRPGPTTPEERAAAPSVNRDTNISYQLAGWESLPTYAVEADTSTATFSTVVRDSSLFGVVFGSQAAFFIPEAQLEDVSAIRASVGCAGSEPSRGSSDQSDLVPFNPASLATAYLGPASGLPEPSTTTTAATTTTEPATATTDSPRAAGDEPDESEEASAAIGTDTADPSSPRDLLGPWAVIVGLAMVAAGVWVTRGESLWGRREGAR